MRTRLTQEQARANSEAEICELGVLWHARPEPQGWYGRLAGRGTHGFEAGCLVWDDSELDFD